MVGNNGAAAPAVTVIVVSYNTIECTRACLRSLYAETDPAAFSLVVIDNASRDGSADMVAGEFPRARLVRLAENIGFARANNLAAEMAESEFLLLLNPDTVVLENAVGRLLEFAREHPDAGIWGGRTVFPDGSLNPSSCWRAMSPWSAVCLATGLSSLARGSTLLNPEGMGAWKRDDGREVDIVSGCFLLIRRDLWERLGGFDRAFFMYGEEADLCLRARRFGARPMVTPQATIVHLGGASERVRDDKLVRLLRAKMELVRRHWGRGSAWIGKGSLLLWPLTRALAHSAILRVRRTEGRAASAAAWWNVWRRRAEWAKGYRE